MAHARFRTSSRTPCTEAFKLDLLTPYIGIQHKFIGITDITPHWRMSNPLIKGDPVCYGIDPLAHLIKFPS